MNTCCRRKSTPPTGCRNSKSDRVLDSYQAVVSDYIQKCRGNLSCILLFYSQLNRLSEAVHNASFALLPNGKRHPHQYRIRKTVLAQVSEELKKINLKNCLTFDDLYNKVDDTIGSISGVGPLMIYDTALRIGAFLKLAPEYVYLHAGTKVGAAALGLPLTQKKLCVQELPQEFQPLSASEIEDCLCIYKNDLKQISIKRKT